MNHISKQGRCAIVLAMLAAAAIAGLLAYREHTNPGVSGPTTIQGLVTITLPPGSRHRILQGIDTCVGEITIGGTGHVVTYDIGGLAGNYARNGSPKDMLFWKPENDQEIPFDSALRREDGRLMLFVSFPSASTANFFTQVGSKRDAEDVLKVLRTLRPAAIRRPRTGSGTED